MKRGDKVVLSISAVLAVAVIGAVAFSLLVLDRRPRPSANSASSSLLVVTWGPSLCRVERDNAGCRSGHVEQLGQTFILHGLWPQPSTEQYCDVPKRLSDSKRTPVQLPDDVESRLQAMMSDAALMTTHEWYAHGTCSGVAAPEYFGIATDLAQEVVRVLNPLFGASSGAQISARSLRQTFDAEFGGGAGMRVALRCKKADRDEEDVAYEVQLSLPAVVDLRDGDNAVPLGRALSRGPTVGAGCGHARVP